jgi:ketosteroid isomerase-like protein
LACNPFGNKLLVFNSDFYSVASFRRQLTNLCSGLAVMGLHCRTTAEYPKRDSYHEGVNKMKRSIAIIALACATSLPGLAQAAKEKQPATLSSEQLILQLENEGREATLKNDLEANDRLLADNCGNINPDGSITTKSKLIELLKAGSFKIMSIDNDEVKVRVYGDAAVVTGLSTSKRAGQGDDIVTRQVRFTRVYAKPKGRWQVVSAHNTLLRQP